MAGRSAPAPKRPPSSSPPAAWAAKLFSMAETSSFIAAMAARGGGDAKNPRLRELCLARLYAEKARAMTMNPEDKKSLTKLLSKNMMYLAWFDS
uniref:Uncharacterized protein n=1 Tax=Oryza meridionalis TaxID=40149 RepID=A0A0E0DX39_9ORYZ